MVTFDEGKVRERERERDSLVLTSKSLGLLEEAGLHLRASGLRGCTDGCPGETREHVSHGRHLMA